MVMKYDIQLDETFIKSRNGSPDVLNSSPKNKDIYLSISINNSILRDNDQLEAQALILEKVTLLKDTKGYVCIQGFVDAYNGPQPDGVSHQQSLNGLRKIIGSNFVKLD